MPLLREAFGLAALGALLGLSWRTISCVHADRRSAVPRAKPEHLQTWEGEGGGVPVGTHRTAAQVEPTEPDSPARGRHGTGSA